MKRSRKNDLAEQVKKTEKALNDQNSEKKSNFNDLSSILIQPEDADE